MLESSIKCCVGHRTNETERNMSIFVETLQKPMWPNVYWHEQVQNERA